MGAESNLILEAASSPPGLTLLTQPSGCPYPKPRGLGGRSRDSSGDGRVPVSFCTMSQPSGETNLMREGYVIPG